MRTIHRLSKHLLGLVLLPLCLAAPAQAQQAKPFTKEQLDQMTAQVALYPDSLLSQLLMATTYPEEFAEAYKWAKAHPDAKGDDAVRAVEKEGWDPAVASMVGFPQVLVTLGEKPDWVKNMGDAFIAQPEDVMDSVQRLRAQAEKAGNLKSNEQIKVSKEAAPPPEQPQTTVVQQAAPSPQVIVIEPAQPQTVYVPSYNPAVVYGAWPYPAYPPYYYPPPMGYWWSHPVATGIAWGVGIGVTAALWGGMNWGRGDVDINVNRYNNINSNNRIESNSNRSNWNHNPEHRKSDYRGGEATRQNLQSKHTAGAREQYRGHDAASRDAGRERASQTMQQRGIESPTGSARERAQSMDRAAASQRSQSAGRDNALKGSSSIQAGGHAQRGASSNAAAQRTGGGGGMASGSGGASRSSMSGGGGGARAGGGGGGARGGGGGGRGGGGRR